MRKMKIAFIVGRGGDEYPLKVTSKYAPDWLKFGGKRYSDNVFQDNTVQNDVAIASYIQYTHPNDTVDVIDASDTKVTKTLLDNYDNVFVFYDAVEVFNCNASKEEKTCPGKSNSFERALATTNAAVYPYPEFHRYILNKSLYYSDLEKAGVPVAQFFKVTPDYVVKAGGAQKLIDRIQKRGWKGAIIKPSYSAYTLGIKVYKDISKTQPKTILKHFREYKKLGFPQLTVQEFVPSFGKNYEIRTFWINGQYLYSIGTFTSEVGKGSGGLGVDAFDTFKSEGGSLPDSTLRKLKPIAKKAIDTIIKYSAGHPVLRIDFGCCLKKGNCIESYFINEVELSTAFVMVSHTDDPEAIIKKMAAAYYGFAKKTKGKIKGSIKGKKYRERKGTSKPKQLSACKTK